MAEQDRVGRLTKLSKDIAPGLVLAVCDCGWSIVMAAAEWGEKLGCTPDCHNAEVRAIEKAKADAAEQAARAAETAKLQADNISPHFDQLDHSQRLLIEMLESFPSFTAGTIATLLNLELDAAKEELMGLVYQNVVTELIGYKKEQRPYQLNTPYSWGASPNSFYQVRAEAIEQRAKLGLAPKAAKARAIDADDDPLQSYEVRGLDEGSFDDFLSAKCVVSAADKAKQVLVRNAYYKFCEENGLQPLDSDEFVAEMYDRFKPNDSGEWTGLRLKRGKDLQPFAEKTGPSKQELAEAEYKRLAA